MAKRNFNDLQAFVMVAREGSFTRAATRIGVTQSALSQTIRNLENQLDIRLLARTTRSVTPTQAGERLLASVGRHFDDIEAELSLLTEFRDKPVGTVRITCGDHVLRNVLLPKLTPLLRQYPDIHMEFDVNYGFRDIVADRFDAGVRLGDTIDKDMIAVPISTELRMAAVASPAYFKRNSRPQSPHDLIHHNCINQRFPSSGGQELNVRVEGQLVLNTSTAIVDAAVQGLGIAFLPEDEFSPHLQEGRLERVLEEWCEPFAGYYLYYPSRRQPTTAFSMVLNALRI